MGPQEAKLPRLSSGPWVLTPVCFAQRGPISPGRGACQALATRELWRPTDQTPLTEGAGGRSRKRLSCAGRTAIRQQSGPPRLAPQVLPQLGPGSGWPSPAHSRQGTYPVAPPGSEGGMGPSSRIFPSACPHPAGHWSSQQPLPALWGHRWSTRGCCPLLPTKLSIRLVGITGSPGVNRKQYK